MRSFPLYWDLAAADYELGRETFPPDAGTCWYANGETAVGIWDLGDQSGKKLLEVGCGHGAALEALAEAFPHGVFQGLDFSPGQLRLAKERTRHLPNVRLSLGDARLGVPQGVAPYDELLSIYGALDFAPNPAAMLDELFGGLVAGGTCTVLTSVLDVFKSVLRHPRMNHLRMSDMDSRWFVRGRLIP